MKTPILKIGLRGHFNEGSIFATTENGAHWTLSIAANEHETPFEPLPWILASSADDLRRTWETWVRDHVGTFPLDAYTDDRTPAQREAYDQGQDDYDTDAVDDLRAMRCEFYAAGVRTAHYSII